MAGAALSASAPALACSCILPDNIEAAGRTAFAKADVVGVLEIGRAPVMAPRSFWCGSDGRARPWFRPGHKIEQSRPARVINAMKGRVSGPISIRTSPVMNIGGRCGMTGNSCQVSLSRSAVRTGPMLFRRVAPDTYEPLDVCTQAAFTAWLEQRQKRRALPQTR
ncbi:hypothetical protein TZ53_25135 (plasmid) [Sphingobium sp. YBL2]|nr:hypothetical protein TZ53_25135 [Sphingobium sp. YBL2]